MKTTLEFESAARSTPQSLAAPGSGLLIVNADDWGRDRQTTERALECIRRGSVSSASAMVFEDDSERAAEITRERKIDVGLHLNLTTAFSAAHAGTAFKEHQQRLSRYLLRHRLAPAVFYPWLSASFEYVVKTQLDEFSRLYGAAPNRIDGHHHMHLCANVVLGRLLPRGTMVRRNFSFQPGEKSWVNRAYRGVVDRLLARRHNLTDLFFCLPPIEPERRLQRIFSLAQQFVVELETHPVEPEEYRFLTGSDFLRLASGIQVAPRYMIRRT